MSVHLVGGKPKHYCGLGDGKGIPEGSIFECDECHRLWLRKSSVHPKWLWVYRWQRISRLRASWKLRGDPTP